MARPPKPVIVLETEGRSHRTKEELEIRKKNEAALLTGQKMIERAEVKSDPVAHKEFTRLRKLLRGIGKDDAIYAGVINRYCQIYSECLAYDQRRASFEAGLEELREEYRAEDSKLEASEYFRITMRMQESINKLDYLAADKRRMLLAIEKECAMTIAAALRSIPKKPEDEDENRDPMAGLLGRRA